MKPFILSLFALVVLGMLLLLSGCGAKTGLPEPDPNSSLIITDVQPRVIMPGTPFTVTGANFNLIPGNNILTIGATTVAVTNATPTALLATMPDDFPSGEYSVSVTANGQTAKFEGTIKVISVYVVGWEGSVAKLWKNTVAKDLTTGGSSGRIVAADIFVNGKDVHIVGDDYSDDTHSRAIYWKNGVPTYLTGNNINSYVHSVTVTSAGDVYIGGNYYDLSSPGNHQSITYWKNGIKQTDITDGSQFAYSEALDASDTDVVIVGQDVPDGPAKYWKNGVPTTLNSSLNQATFGHDIKLNGTDVYVAGEIRMAPPTVKTDPAYWVNGIGTTLSTFPTSSPSSPNRSWAYSIAISGSDIYFGGTMWLDNSFTGACYWKLGTTPFVSVTDPSNGSGVGGGIAVSGSDVFFAGDQIPGYPGPSPGRSIAKLWINGLEYKLTDGTQDASAAAIFIK